jgi:hypothetical protein
VIEVSPEMRKFILNLDKINIDYSCYNAKDYLSITWCFRCLGIGQSQKYCLINTINCSHCGESGHSHNDCNSIVGHKRCINCKKFNETNKNPNVRKYDTKHDALYGNCSTFIHIKSLMETKIDYGYYCSKKFN